jgi:hypothetical protein
MPLTTIARILALPLATACLLVAPRARACGVSASGVASCSLDEHNEATRPHWAIGVSGLYTSTRLRFSDSLRTDQVRYASLATIGYLPSPKLVLQLSAGAAFGGSLQAPNGEHQFSPGPTGAFGVGYRAFDNGRYFLLLTGSLSFAHARTQLQEEPKEAYTALDLRLGAEAGVQLANLFRPYAVLRGFGGPVFWHYESESVTGNDVHRYQVGAGLGVRISSSLSLTAEGIPLGERAVSLGVGLVL